MEHPQGSSSLTFAPLGAPSDKNLHVLNMFKKKNIYIYTH